MNTVFQEATGRWPAILTKLGIPREFLRNRHGPCVLCGGTDRYRFDNKDGKGTYYCNSCGPGDAWTLLTKVHGWDYAKAAQEVEKIIGVCPMTETTETPIDFEKRKSYIKTVWKEAKEDSIVTGYLKSRGMVAKTSALRGHPGLKYKDGQTYPAVLGLLQNAEGKVVGIHRIFLLGQGKRDKTTLKCAETINGSAVRLFPLPPSGRIGIAEGIENALAVNGLSKVGFPVWASLTANNLEKFEPPPGVVSVSVFGDCDESFTGQAAAWVLAKRLKAQGFSPEVHIPKSGDWLEVFAGKLARRVA